MTAEERGGVLLWKTRPFSKSSDYWRRRRRVSWNFRLALLGIFITGIPVYLIVDHFRGNHQPQEYQAASHFSRHLSANVTHEGLAWEQCDFENEHSPYAWVVFHALVILVIFIALAIICDDFFVPSLEAISQKLELSEDVAGATFMAAGSSAPELFTSVAGVAQETDVGVGTIVGSAVFNILIIVALTAALAGQVLSLDWRPLARDSTFYALSIGAFIAFSWDGKIVHYEAALLVTLYLFYVLIMVLNPRLMKFLEPLTCDCCRHQSVAPSDEEALVEKDTETTTSIPMEVAGNNLRPLEEGPPTSRPTLPPIKRLQDEELRSNSSSSLRSGQHIFHHIRQGELAGNFTNSHHDIKALVNETGGSKPNVNGSKPNVNGSLGSLPTNSKIDTPRTNGVTTATNGNVYHSDMPPEKKTNADPEEKNPEGIDDDETIQLFPCMPSCPEIKMSTPDRQLLKEGAWGITKFILKWILFVISFPFMVIFTLTIPDCSKPHLKKWYMLSFTMSIVWIAALSFAMTTLAARAGCILGIDQYTMGLVVIAIGTSVPDALSSILVGRDGYGDMAVSNAIGSNVFDINLGLGLPFVIRIIITAGDSIHLLSNEEEIALEVGDLKITPHVKFGFVLLLILLFTMIAFSLVKFKLSKVLGISFVILYIVFLFYAFFQEFYCNLDRQC